MWTHDDQRDTYTAKLFGRTVEVFYVRDGKMRAWVDIEDDPRDLSATDPLDATVEVEKFMQEEYGQITGSGLLFTWDDVGSGYSATVDGVELLLYNDDGYWRFVVKGEGISYATDSLYTSLAIEKALRYVKERKR